MHTVKCEAFTVGLTDKTSEQSLLTSDEASDARPYAPQLIEYTGTHLNLAWVLSRHCYQS